MHLGTLSAAAGESWKQAFYYLYLLIFYQRSIEDRAVLDRFISDHHRLFNLSGEEASLMQSMAEHYLEQGIEQGIEQGARQTSIESTLAILNERFPAADGTAVRSILEAIGDLDRLKHLNLQASIVPSFKAFQEHLDA